MLRVAANVKLSYARNPPVANPTLLANSPPPLSLTSTAKLGSVLSGGEAGKGREVRRLGERVEAGSQ